MVPRTGAGDVEQVALGVIDFLQVRVVADCFDSLLQGYDLVVAGHHDDRTELQSLSKVHGAYAGVTAGRLDVLIQDLERDSCLVRGRTGAVQLRRRPDEDAEFMGRHTFLP